MEGGLGIYWSKSLQGRAGGCFFQVYAVVHAGDRRSTRVFGGSEDATGPRKKYGNCVRSGPAQDNAEDATKTVASERCSKGERRESGGGWEAAMC
jgi:hypothetical protein